MSAAPRSNSPLSPTSYLTVRVIEGPNLLEALKLLVMIDKLQEGMHFCAHLFTSVEHVSPPSSLSSFFLASTPGSVPRPPSTAMHSGAGRRQRFNTRGNECL